jgi:Spy/CpxP family protein refolding chaperone
MSQREEVERLEQQLAAARRAALEAAFAEVLDEAQFRRLARSVADIEIELTVLRAKALAGLVPRLTQSQKKQALDKMTV